MTKMRRANFEHGDKRYHGDDEDSLCPCFLLFTVFLFFKEGRSAVGVAANETVVVSFLVC